MQGTFQLFLILAKSKHFKILLTFSSAVVSKRKEIQLVYLFLLRYEKLPTLARKAIQQAFVNHW